MADTINTNSFFNQSEEDGGGISSVKVLAQNAFDIATNIRTQFNNFVQSFDQYKLETGENDRLISNTVSDLDIKTNETDKRLEDIIEEFKKNFTSLEDDIGGQDDKIKGLEIRVDKITETVKQIQESQKAAVEKAADDAFRAQDAAQKAGDKKDGGVAAGGLGGLASMMGVGDKGSGGGEKKEPKGFWNNPWMWGLMAGGALHGMGAGIKRGIGGAADFLTGGLFDFDKRSGGGGLRKIGSGLKNMFGGKKDGDKEGKGLFGGLFGGKKKDKEKGVEAEVNDLESRVNALESGDPPPKDDGSHTVKDSDFSQEDKTRMFEIEQEMEILEEEGKVFSPEYEKLEAEEDAIIEKYSGKGKIEPKKGTDEKGLEPTSEKGTDEKSEKKEKGLFGDFFGGLFGKKKDDQDDQTSEENVKKTSKISKEFKFGKNTYDLSKPLGGLSRKEFEALEDDKERNLLVRRLRIYANQNPEERHKAIKNNETSPKEGSDIKAKETITEKGLELTGESKDEEGEKKEKGLFGGFFGGLFGKKEDDKEDDKPEVKTSSFSESIKYTVRRGEVDPDSLEEGVPLEKAQQHWYKKNIDELNFKIRNGKRRGTDTSAMEEQLVEWQTKYNNTLEFGGIPVGYQDDKGLQPTGDQDDKGLQPTGEKGEGGGFKRAVGGFADFATGGTFDFDKKNRKGAPKDFGIRRVAGGVADWATMGLTDFDKRGKGNLQVNPLFGGKDKAWGSANEQAKRGEKQSGMGIKRGIGGALDFATLGTFDFDKQNRKGAPKGWGIKRVAGGLADAITMGATDFDKRGTGIGQMKLGERRTNQKAREAYENNPRVQEHRKKIFSLQERSSKIPMETTENSDGSITSKGEGRLVGGELFTPGQPLNAKQYTAIKMGVSMGNTYSNEIMQSYKMHEEQRGKTNDAIQSNTSGSKEFMNDITQPPPTEGDMTPPSEASPPPTDVQGIETGQAENEPNNMPPDAVSIEHPAVGTECQVDCINMLKSNSYYNLGF